MRKRVFAISAALCMALVLAGCGSKKDVSYDAGAGGDDSFAAGENPADEKGGLLAEKLGIPESAQVELPTDGTKIKKITIDDPDIVVPDKDRMYTKSYRMGILTNDTKKEFVETFLNKEDGIYDYSMEMFDAKDTDREKIDKYFEDNDGKTPDYSGDYFIGKIDGEPYVVRFMYSDENKDEGVAVSRACPEDIADDMAARQVKKVTYYDYNPDDLKEKPTQKDTETDQIDKEDDNGSGMNPEQAGRKAAEYLASWGFKDIVQTNIIDMYKAYEDDRFNIIQYSKDGYIVRFDASVNDSVIYQPVTSMIDTITLQSSNEGGSIMGSDCYYQERSYYQLSFNEDGVVTFYAYWPMRSDDDLHPVDHLITWDEAVECLKKAVPQHFADYTGYSEVKFNDVRLAYFRTKTGDKQYEVIPVYVFAQLESWAEESNAPSQLIMIDARDGSEVDIIQDQGRLGVI